MEGVSITLASSVLKRTTSAAIDNIQELNSFSFAGIVPRGKTSRRGVSGTLVCDSHNVGPKY